MLSDRIEAAEGPSRELDAEIAVTVDGGEIVWRTANGTMENYPVRRYVSADHVGGYGSGPVPAYTASLDAAMMLVPDKAWFDITQYWIYGDNVRAFFAKVYMDGWGSNPSRIYKVFDLPTPALALCAAALRARGL